MSTTTDQARPAARMLSLARDMQTTLAAQRARYDTLADSAQFGPDGDVISAGTPARGHLRLVRDPEPEHPATPCPAWCIADHPAGDTNHYADATWSGPVSTALDIDEDGLPTLAIEVPGPAAAKLDIDELDGLIADLLLQRAALFATIAERCAA